MQLSQGPTRFFLSHRFSMFAICLAAILALSPSSVWAQTSTAGTVVGQVVDEQNAAIPGAEVRVTETSTNISQTAATNSEGRYVFSQVNPGNYNVGFSKQGFASYQVNNQTVEIGQSLTLNAKLKVGSNRHHGRGVRILGRAIANHERHRRRHLERPGAAPTAELGPRRDLIGGAAAGYHAEWSNGRVPARFEHVSAGWRQRHRRHVR